MFGTPYTAATQPPSNPKRQPSHPIPTPIPPSGNQQHSHQQNPAPYYVQYPGRQNTTHQGHNIIAPPPNNGTPLKELPFQLLWYGKNQRILKSFMTPSFLLWANNVTYNISIRKASSLFI